MNRLALLTQALSSLQSWLNRFPGSHGGAAVQPGESGELHRQPSSGEMETVLTELVRRLEGNYPFHSPVYAGQMLKPPHELAWLAHSLTMLINPNNHALDGGPPTSVMEKEVIPQFARMFGFTEPVLGHLTSSGTIANLEALWVARNVHPGKGIAFSDQAHYTHERMCSVLGIPSFKISTTPAGEWNLHELESIKDRVGTVVVTMGTTGAGRVEPLHELLPLFREMGLRVHLDAAYGGYFKLLEGTGAIDPLPWGWTGEADSLVIDPHKHCLQPYGCGCVLFRDPAVGRYYKHDSPYTYFSSDDLHLGEISLECSRAGAAAAGLWATLQVFGLEPMGRMGQVMQYCRKAAVRFADAAVATGRFVMLEAPELDIVVYAGVPEVGARTLRGVSAVSERVFRRGMERGADGVYVSLYTVPASQVLNVMPDLQPDAETVTVLRSVLMKPEHRDFVPELVRRLESLL